MDIIKFFYFAFFLLFTTRNVVDSSNNNNNNEELNEDNWRGLLENNEWMIEFYAPWCPACNRLKPIWDQFSSKAKELNIKIGAIDLTKYPSLSGLFSVTSLPTIYHVKDKQYRVYEGNRDLDDLIEFVRDEKWKDVKPLSEWFSPDSVIMKLVGYLFKITIYFKDVYTSLSEDYGLPNWLVLTIFVFVTILVGLILGILLIICIDYVCWPRKYEPPKDLKDDEDLVDEKKEEEEKKKEEVPVKEKEEENKQKEKQTNVKKRKGARKVE